jgi:transposase
MFCKDYAAFLGVQVFVVAFHSNILCPQGARCRTSILSLSSQVCVIQVPQREGETRSNLYWLSEEQLRRFRPYFPKSHGVPRVDDRRVLSAIIFINRKGLRCCDAPKEYGPPKTLYHRWSDMGVFARIMTGLAAESPDDNTISIDATYLKAYRTAGSLLLN